MARKKRYSKRKTRKLVPLKVFKRLPKSAQRAISKAAKKGTRKRKSYRKRRY